MIDLANKLNRYWVRSERGRKISVASNSFITPQSRLFAMGSCFALEIRYRLKHQGFNIGPKYYEIEFDRTRQVLGDLPYRDNINHYDTFVIRQEFERAFGGLAFSKDDFWSLQGLSINDRIQWESVHQNPYRKFVLGRTEDDLLELNGRLDQTMDDAIHNSDVYLITLGMIEAWLNRDRKKFVCLPTGTRGMGSGGHKVSGYLSTFEENYSNMVRVCDLIFGSYPDRKIVITTSPVALAGTFTGNDIVVANMESKSILRAVCGALVRKYKNVFYLPSYEHVMYHDFFEPCGRRVSRAGVASVIDMFSKMFMDESSQSMTQVEPESFKNSFEEHNKTAF